jgi:predicted 3-demethylubiquinone-9 3-methyltransferase (glyoxalase superfamily)
MLVTPFLMFEGQAEAAMELYVSVFPRSRVVAIDRYDEAGPGKTGTVKHARFEVGGLALACIDSPARHAFTFTPSTSLIVDCDSLEQLEVAFAKLSDGGKILMPPGAYGFSQRFAWVQDRFGFSWQINLP